MCPSRCSSTSTTKQGGWACLHLGGMRLLYSDGSNKNGVVSSEPLAQSERGREVLCAYAATTKGPYGGHVCTILVGIWCPLVPQYAQ
jgi:hypothetical protein